MTEAALMATNQDTGERKKRGETSIRRFLTGDFAPVAGILAVTLGLAIFTAVNNAFFLTEFSIQGMLTLAAALAFAAMAQQLVMLTGGIDLSVGPAMGFLLVVGSFWLMPGSGPVGLALGILGLILLALLISLVNWLPTLFGVPLLMVTLVAFIGLQGIALFLRPMAGGAFDEALLSVLSINIGWVPLPAIIAIVIAIGLELALRRTNWGARIRAVGSNPTAAFQSGMKVSLVRLLAGGMAAVLVLAAAMLLMAQVRAGDANAGTSFTLASITAAIVGGASIFGGRGSILGAVGGALLIQQINVTTVFLGLNVSWQSYMLGGLALVAAGAYSLARRGAGNGR